jgi:AcrR family transcriptional regulator
MSTQRGHRGLVSSLGWQSQICVNKTGDWDVIAQRLDHGAPAHCVWRKVLPVSDSLAVAAIGGRRPRLALDEVERRVLNTARELLIGRQGGLTVSLEHINLEVIIAAAGVPRSSAHRRWPTKDDFVLDFLCDIAGPDWAGTAAFDAETIRVAVATAQQHADWLATVEGRVRLRRELVRVSARKNFETLMQSSDWRTYVALTATVVSMPEDRGRARIQERLRESETTFIERMTTFYSGMAQVLGFRARAPFTFRHLAATGAAIVEGLALRQMVNLELVSEPLELDAPSGGSEEWVLAAQGFLAVLEAMTEMDPDFPDPDANQIAAIAAASTDDLAEAIVPGLASFNRPKD